MLTHYKKDSYGNSDLGWLQSLFHFSFSGYYNPERKSFGAIRVVNDDIIQPDSGFDLHPHQDMEIISYIIEGELTHGDSMGNMKTLSRGNIQYMSAGSGIYHSEFNHGNTLVRLLQIWIYPDQNSYDPNYGDHSFAWDLRNNKLLHLVSSYEGNAPVKIHQDLNIYALELDENQTIDFKLEDKRQVYLVQIEGKSLINEIEIEEKDSLESIEESLAIKAIEKSHFLIIEMKKN